MDLPGASVLLDYGPLGVMVVVALVAIVALWQSLRSCQREQRELLENTIDRQLKIMRAAVKREERRAEEYTELLLKLEQALRLLAERVNVEEVNFGD